MKRLKSLAYGGKNANMVIKGWLWYISSLKGKSNSSYKISLCIVRTLTPKNSSLRKLIGNIKLFMQFSVLSSHFKDLI